MMGNESSRLSGLTIQEDSVVVTGSWSLHDAAIDENKLSVFISPIPHKSTAKCQLEIGSKNLMLYRHPSILKYVSSWMKDEKFFLVTENVKPLSQALQSQTSLQICIGLHSVLKAIVFLHEKAMASHNNICCASVFVSSNGEWKLGGFEFLCQFSNLTYEQLQASRAHRYEKAVAPEENSFTLSLKQQPTAIDQFAFGILAEEVLSKCSSDGIPDLQDFLELSKRHLQSSEASLRPKLSSLLDHPFCCHDFISVHSFLSELPLKLEEERRMFFRSIFERLKTFPEELVAIQLSRPLLARMVFLDVTAQEYLLPHVLCPIDENLSHRAKGLFSPEIYKKYIVPRLVEMFHVHDTQIRLLLLSYFEFYINMFSCEQLKVIILPELLVAIKDTNDQLVSATLHALAILVPVLGAATVVGGKRAKLFSDGNPKVYKRPSRKPHSPSKEAIEIGLPERLSPDGGEDKGATTDEEAEAWSDWETPEPPVDPSNKVTQVEKIPSVNAANILPDISCLDIKESVNTGRTSDEIDYFMDMEPVISKPTIYQVEDATVNNVNSLLQMSFNTEEIWEKEGDAWNQGFEDWEEEKFENAG